MKMYFLLDMVEFHVSFTRKVYKIAKVFSYNKSIKSRSKHPISYPQEYFLIAVTFMFLNLVGHTTSFYLESVTLAAGWTPGLLDRWVWVSSPNLDPIIENLRIINTPNATPKQEIGAYQLSTIIVPHLTRPENSWGGWHWGGGVALNFKVSIYLSELGALKPDFLHGVILSPR